MKKTLSITILGLIFSFNQAGFCQIGKWDLSLYGGYSLPTRVLQDTYYNVPNKLSGYNLGMASGYNITKQKDLSLTGTFNFNHLLSTYHFENLTDVGGIANVTLNIVSLDLGIRYKFFKKEKVCPFAGIELSGNYYTGNTDVFEDYTNDETTYKLKPAFRLGLQVGTGLEINLSRMIGLIAGYKFNFSNLIGRSKNIEYIEGEYGLNDAFNPDYSQGLDIFYSQFYTGVSFYP